MKNVIMKKLLLMLLEIFITVSVFGQWTKEHFSDEFGDTTKQAYIAQKCIGTFTNSATEDSELTVIVMVYFKNSYTFLRFELCEYGRIPSVVVGKQDCSLMIKTTDGITSSFYQKNYYDKVIYNLSEVLGEHLKQNEKWIARNLTQSSVLLEKLKTESAPIKFYIRLENGSTYNFIVDPRGFASLYESL
jgi:hypothetical protein